MILKRYRELYKTDNEYNKFMKLFEEKKLKYKLSNINVDTVKRKKRNIYWDLYKYGKYIVAYIDCDKFIPDNYTEELFEQSIFERHECIKKLLHNIDDKYIQVLDESQIKLIHCTPHGLNLIHKLVNISQNFYPDFALKTLLINPPQIFTNFIWPVIFPFLQTNVRDRIHIIDIDEYEKIKEQLLVNN